MTDREYFGILGLLMFVGIVMLMYSFAELWFEEKQIKKKVTKK